MLPSGPVPPRSPASPPLEPELAPGGIHAVLEVVEEVEAQEPDIRTELGSEAPDVAFRFNGKPAGVLAIRQEAGANALDTADRVKAKIDEIAKSGGEREAEVRAYFSHPERRRSFENELLDRKAIDLLREKAVVTGA